MTPEQKYRDLEASALAVLRHPWRAVGFVPLVQPSVRFVVWRQPAFEPYQSWALINEEAIEEMWLLRRVTWNRSEDYGRASNPIRQAGFMMETAPTPTLDAVDVKVSAGLAARMLDSVARLELPGASRADQLGLDGVVNGIAIEDRGIELEWWCEGPPAWRPFTDRVESFRLDLEAAFARSP